MSSIFTQQDIQPCFDCGRPFATRPKVTRCFHCRSRRNTTIQEPVDFIRSTPSSFDPHANSFELPASQSRKRRGSGTVPSTKKQKTSNTNDPVHDIIHQAVSLLDREYQSRVQASHEFPPEISASQIRSSISRYGKEILNAHRQGVCSCCGMLVPLSGIRQIHDEEPVLQGLDGLLDICGRDSNCWNLCSSCHAALLQESFPKFSAKNHINVTLCQQYPKALEDLTLTEEYLIARCHPIGVVLKLRSAGRSSPLHYDALRGHFIVIPQDPGPLLQILPSPELALHSLIKIFWIGHRPPTQNDLKPFLIVRKHAVLAALQYLVEHNHLYTDVTINHSITDEWPDDFIPPELQDSVILLDSDDHHEREGYTVHLQDGNYENDWQAAENGFSTQDAVPLLTTASVATDINGERQNPEARILHTLYNLVTNAVPDANGSPLQELGSDLTETEDTRTPVISYQIQGKATLLNHWKDPHYFTAAFPTLFPKGSGGHLDERNVPVSIAPFANWALRHHSRRFARHRTFMYTLYDVIQLRRSSLGNALLSRRSDWNSITRDINTVTVTQLENATTALSAGQPVDNPVIQRLLRNVTAIGVKVPGSFFHKLQLRAELRGLIVREGMAAFWLTINPSDLQNPLVLTLAGMDVSNTAVPTATAAIHHAVATSNPVAVAQFFHYTCKATLNKLLTTDSENTGIFGDVSNYFGVVETNGRGMLHLHTLVWVRGNLESTTLRDRLLGDANFAARMIRYLETVIVQSISEVDERDPNVLPPEDFPSTIDGESDFEFYDRLLRDSNNVARQKQLHSKNHSATCFKYKRNGSGQRTCRFDMPREIIPQSTIDKFGIIHLRRNHQWVTPWNAAIASCIRSNHDISWIPTISKSLSILYYITNYATKDDVSPWQTVAKAALLKRAIDRAKSNLSPTARDVRLREKDTDNFALRCFNALSQDREISGVQIASTLLRLPSYYTASYNFTRINLWWLRRYVQEILQSRNPNANDTAELMAEEPCMYDQNASTAPVSTFDNYKYRGPHLASLSIFEYCMLVRTRTVRDATTTDIAFDADHACHTTHVQRIARTRSQIATVTLQGQLTQFQAAEDSIPGGNPITAAIMNDIAEILLGLFVPWQVLSSLFQQHAFRPSQTSRDIFSQIWALIEPTLLLHNRTFAKNVQLLRKSHEDCQADAALQNRTDFHTDSIQPELNDLNVPDMSSDPDDLPPYLTENYTAETLITAFDSINRAWTQELIKSAQYISILLPDSLDNQTLQLQHIHSLDMNTDTILKTSGLRFVPSTTLQDWEMCLKGHLTPGDQERISANPLDSTYHLDDFNVHIGDGILYPALTEPDLTPYHGDPPAHPNENPTGMSITAHVAQTLPLNQKQRIIAERILSEALLWANHPYDASKRPQTLLYIGGEGGVGKSQIIRAVVAGMALLHRKNEVILMAPTGAAADNIGGNTYHTSLGISLNPSRRGTMGSRVRNLWSNKTIMIVDEVSMMDLTMLSVINNHCKRARSLNRDSPDLFGGLPVVILMGDFFQFPPVSGLPLWKPPRHGNDNDHDGQLIWHQFKQVVLLNEQMRQAEDPTFHELLSRARSGTFNEKDCILLNKRVLTSLFTPELRNITMIVKLNSLRHIFNRVRMEHFARIHHQKIYIFPAIHTRTISTVSAHLPAENLLEKPEQGSKVPFPGLFLYTRNMPVMLLTNICTPLGLVNGATGHAIGIAIEPTELFELSNLYILCTQPPATVLFKHNRSTSVEFTSLENGVMPIFPLERSITVKQHSVRRKQVPLCPAFCLTDYKVQGSTLTSAVLDLKDDPRSRVQDRHRKYCSMYVQLSRLRSLTGLHLLRNITMADLQYQPDPQLLSEMIRLQDLEKETLHAWQHGTTH